MSVDELTTQIRQISDTLPSLECADADRLLGEAHAALTQAAAGSESPDLNQAVSAYAHARERVVEVYQVCEQVRRLLAGYLPNLGADSQPVAQTPAPGPNPATRASSTSTGRGWQTVAEEHDEVRSYRSYSAAKRALGNRQGQELHHIVEQCQSNNERAGFSIARINTTDNFVYLAVPVHRQVTAFYARKPPGMQSSRRDIMSDMDWDEQYRHGRRAVTRALREYEQNE